MNKCGKRNSKELVLQNIMTYTRKISKHDRKFILFNIISFKFYYFIYFL